MIRALSPLLLALFLAPAAVLGEIAPPAAPHDDAVSCRDCHPGAEPGDEVADCDICHDASRNIHPIGMKPNVEIPDTFALDAEGKLLCRTCHTIHKEKPDPYLLNVSAMGGRTGRAAFCGGCHGVENVRTNPHSARQGDSRCVFCHKTPAKAGEENPYKTLRTEVVRLCDFCHDKVGMNHPRNIDPELKIPEDLPRSPGEAWDCATCHDPHGTTATTQHIRLSFARQMERGRQDNPHRADYFACRACHTESDAKSIRLPGGNLRYRGDLDILCVSCHVTDKGHHPTGLKLPDAMRARFDESKLDIPLDEEAHVTCGSCHDNQCADNTFRMNVRYYDAKTYRTDLCWACHDRTEYAKTSPHVQDENACLRCHEHRPVPGISMELMAVPMMVCLHCHDVKPHPVGRSHLTSPTASIHVDPKLPTTPSGDVTCVTCHDPHYTERTTPYRLRAAPMEICALCHWKS